jgi:signal transduction histidine kinase
MAQALANILGNAVDEVSEKTGRVILRVSVDDGALVFEVRDNGRGIHLEPEQDLFKPFYTQKEAGTGLGLTIAHRTVAAHGGAIRYHNLDEGGACFDIRVPLEAD